MTIGADALDSLAGDWALTDDPGAVESWPAPDLGLDDRSGPPVPRRRPAPRTALTTTGLPDAFAYLRGDHIASLQDQSTGEELAINRYGFVRRGNANLEAGDLHAPPWLRLDNAGALFVDGESVFDARGFFTSNAPGPRRPANYSSLPREERRRLVEQYYASQDSGLDRAVATAVNTIGAVAKVVAPFAQTALSFVPGVGAVVNGAVAAGAALAQGKPITEAMIDAAASAVPGGPIAKQAFNTARNLVEGQSITQAALNAARDNLPGGQAARAAFDTAVALAQGKSLQKAAATAAARQITNIIPNLPGQVGKAITTAATSIVPAVIHGQNVGKALVGAAEKTAMASLSPYASRALSTVGPQIGKISSSLPSLVPPDAKKVADAILNNPALRSVPIAELSRRLNVPESVARAGTASLVQAVQRAGGPALPKIAPAPHLESRIPTSLSFDNAIARLASRAAPKAYSPNVQRTIAQARRATPIVQRLMGLTGARGYAEAGALDPSQLPTLRQGSSGEFVKQWQKILGVAPDGQFGPNTAAATKTFQASRGLGADGIVGPKTWAAGLASLTPATTPVALPPVALPPLPPVVTTVATAATPTLRQGSSGPAVAVWQGIVGVPADGKFGPATAAATVAFQRTNGLAADGIVGPATWARGLARAASTPPALPPSTPISTVPITVATAATQPTIREGSSGPAVVAWQRIVGVAPDGKFGPNTKAATIAFQRANGLAADGIVGPATWAKGLAQSRPATTTAIPTPTLPPIVIPPVVSVPPGFPGFPELPPIFTPTRGGGETPPIIPIPPFIPGSTSTTPTPDGPVTQTTDPTGGVVTVTQPPIFGKPGIGPLVVLGLLGFALLGGRRKIV